MNQPTLYCPECGIKLDGNRCPEHPHLVHDIGQDPFVRALPPAETSDRKAKPWLPALLALVIVGGAVESILLVQKSGRVTNELADLRSRSKELGQQIRDQREATKEFSRRIAVLESASVSEPDLATLAKTAQDSVFTVEAVDSLGASTSQGSGFVVEAVDNRSVLLTNYHVIAQAVSTGGRIKIRRQDLTFPATVIATNEDVDLAAIEVNESLPALVVEAERPKVGDSVVVVGSPLGLEQTVTTGIVSAYRKGYMQFSAAVSPGSSGGALVNPDGRVVGVVVFKIAGADVEGLSFAIPIGKACQSVISC